MLVIKQLNDSSFNFYASLKKEMKSNNWLVDFNFLSVKDRGTKTCNKNLSFKDPESPDLPVLQNLHFVLSHRLQGNNHTASGLRQGFSEACLSKGLSHSPAV